MTTTRKQNAPRSYRGTYIPTPRTVRFDAYCHACETVTTAWAWAGSPEARYCSTCGSIDVEVISERLVRILEGKIP